MRKLDVALALVLAGFIALDTSGLEHAWALPLVAAPIAIRTRAPLACVAAVCAALGTYGAVYGDPDSVSTLPPALLAAYSAGAHHLRARAYAGAGILLALAASVAVAKGIEEFFFVGVLAGAPWIAGLLSREHARRAARLEQLATELEHEQREHRRLALAAEQARIAAELNDAIVHAVSAMTLQADAAAGALRRDPAAARRALGEVQETGRDAMLELRRMLGLLRGAPG